MRQVIPNVQLRPVARSAQSRFFPPDKSATTISSMALLQILIQVVADWARDILMDILGRRTERLVDKWLKKRRPRRGKGSRGNEQREGSRE
jgi:hypothetical protein